jgi:hypothetical protein
MSFLPPEVIQHLVSRREVTRPKTLFSPAFTKPPGNPFATMVIKQPIAQPLYLYELERSETKPSGYGGVHKSI